ncbi:MAG: alpha/beta fold hydrolase [Pirellulales bacterium]|nr:alpha/beta fold hydrolase [Pirellulales bacterium]
MAFVASILLAGLALLAIVVGVVWIVYVPVIARGLEHVPWLDAEPQPALAEGETCRFTTADERHLVGTYLRTTASARLGVVLCCHELTGDRWTLLPYVADLRRRGFDLFCFDFRNHGESEAALGYRPLPWLTEYELTDLRAALDYVAARDDADPRGVGLFGVSRGGVAALCLAGRDARVRAVVADGAYATAAMQVYYIRRYMSIFTMLTPFFSRLPEGVLAALAWGARRRVERRHGIRFAPVERAFRRVRQPVLVIHGALDRLVPQAYFERWIALLPRVTSWVVPGARHNGALEVAREEYGERVAGFFVEHLAGEP